MASTPLTRTMSSKPDYKYGTISSLLLTTDRTALPRRDKLPQPRWQAEGLKEMGSSVQPKDIDKQKNKASEKPYSSEKADYSGFGYADIIEVTQDIEGLIYRPRTAETRQVYELILSAVYTALGDHAQEVVRSAADTVLQTWMDDRMEDSDEEDMEGILGPITSDEFSQLINLSDKTTDYSADDETKADPDEVRKEGEIDEQGGVAVVIDEEEQEDVEVEVEDYDE